MLQILTLQTLTQIELCYFDINNVYMARLSFRSYVILTKRNTTITINSHK